MFIGIDLPEDGKKYIYNNIKDIIEQYDLKWVDYRLYHLTLKFLGEISEKELSNIDKKLNEISKRYKAFELKLNSLGKFPVYSDKLNVLWLGVEYSKELEDLAIDIQNNFKNFGDNKPFSPHITLARNKNGTSITLKEKTFDYKFVVDKITLFESILPGPIYKTIKVYPLKL
jgi:2'-5' RNA ligase